MKRAYTLIELLAVLALIGILCSIAVLNIGKLNILTDEKEVKSFVDDLEYTRSLAIFNKKSYLFQLNQDNKSYKIIDINDNIVKEVKLEKLKVINNYDGSKTRIIFYPTASVSKSFTYILEGEENKFHVSIAVATGKINLKKK